MLISKLFSSAGFATQIGSILYLVPIFLSLYLSILEMKHNFSKTANKLYEDMENTGFGKKKSNSPFDNLGYAEDVNKEIEHQKSLKSDT